MLQKALPALLVLAALAPARAQTASSPASAWQTATDERLNKKEFEPALEMAARGLEFHPDDAKLLGLAAQAALENGENDLALWYAELALEQWRGEIDPAAKEKPAPLVDLERLIGLIDPLERRSETLLAAYRQALFDSGKSIAKRKLYVNAVDLLGKSRELGLGLDADAELAKIYDNKKAVEALLDTGLDVPIKAKRKKKSDETIAREDARHSTWETCYEVKGDNYTIKTDMNSEMAQSMSLAMEQVNRFYRKVFGVKERGGNTARVVVSVYKSRAEFDRYEADAEVDENVLAFFVPGQNRVAAYDLREHGYAISELWSTLFHEASHQFTHLVSADLIPGWLNEGTASYFEGARLLPNGAVETNLVPEERLFYLKESLDDGEPTLKDVVSYYQPGSYDGSFYPFGWGLVYFLLNFENDKCERVYEPVYRDYMAAYGSGGKHDPFARFVEYFVTRAKQPGVKTFEEFEQRWKTWILELHGLYFGDAAKADVLIARARKQVANKKSEAALESYRWALRKRPGDATAMVELGDLLAAQKSVDPALYYYRKALVTARSDPQVAPAIAERSSKQIAVLDEEVGKAIGAAETKLFASCQEAAKGYVEKEFPHAALRLLDLTRAASGGSAELSALRAQIVEDTQVDTLRWRRPLLDPELTQWQRDDSWKPDGEQLFGKSKRSSFALWKQELPDTYRVEVRWKSLQLEPGAFVAVLFGAGEGALQYFGCDDDGLFEVGRLVKKWDTLEELGVVPKEVLASLEIAIEVSPRKTLFFLNGKQVYERVYAPDELAGHVGLVLQDGSGGFEDFRVRY